MFLHLSVSHSVHGGVRQTPPGQTPPRQTHNRQTPWADTPWQTPLHRDGHYSGRYASYWNAFLFSVCSTKFELLQNSSAGNASRCKHLIKQKEASLQNCFRLATSLHGNTVNYKKPWCNVKKCRKDERRLTDQLGAVDIYVLKGIVDKRACLKYGIVLGDGLLTVDGYVIITVYLHKTPITFHAWNKACYVMITFDRPSPSMTLEALYCDHPQKETTTEKLLLSFSRLNVTNDNENLELYFEATVKKIFISLILCLKTTGITSFITSNYRQIWLPS